jgi:uncharacterized protein (UPF0303 family)
MTQGDAVITGIDTLERSLALSHFDVDDAWKLGSHLRGIAADRNAPVAIEIRRSNGHTLFAACLAGATSDTAAWAGRKIAVALRFERSSLAVSLDLQQRGLSLVDFGLSISEFAGTGGAVPIRVEGAGCVAAAAMGGLSSEEDHRLVLEALTWLHRSQSAP